MKKQRYLVSGSLWLDRTDERIWRGSEELRLGGKAFAFLLALMEQPRTLVSKEDLFERVWPGLTVSESVLTTAAKEIRQAVGDDARNPRLIQTVYGRGYRFLGDTQPSDQPPKAEPTVELQKPAHWRRLHIAVAAAVGAIVIAIAAMSLWLGLPGREQAPQQAIAHPKSIAVLPFEDLSPGHDQQWFATGLTEEILNSLARTPDLHVAARTSTMSIGTGDVREIGRRLNVAHILEGSVRRDSSRVRVTAQLVRTSDGFQLWSQNFDRPASDVVSIQENIAIAIARSLNTVMSPERLQAMVSLGTRSVDAYEEYLKGLAYDQRGLVTGADADHQLALDAFERARRIDPAFAAAQWASAQNWYGNTTRVGSSVTERRGTEAMRLKEYLIRVDAAIAASRGRPEQYKYRSARSLIDLRFRESVQLMRKYLAERPRDLDAWDELVDLAGYISDRRLMAHAAERIHSISMESGSPKSRALTASVLSLDIENAVRRSREQLARSPGEALIQYQAHRALLWGGYRDEARDLLGRIRTSGLPEENKLLAELRQACADGGAGASEIAARMARSPDASTSGAWHRAVLLSDPAGAAEALQPLDRPERLTTLMQYLVYPTFDVRPFPLLEARLKADGISRPPPVAIPYACRASRPDGALGI